ncbi:exocyst complex component 3-like isoform X2 [Denticeps clupeoides]|uniref:exocyst complex component 3-like isoform X2 n=1 Tax=Denticeps clupeoides TaxID=299321 RepID=UPI0010A4B749|nr:exocyst complex component 3-like isoform X2 [Denticeps clupeoides]
MMGLDAQGESDMAKQGPKGKKVQRKNSITDMIKGKLGSILKDVKITNQKSLYKDEHPSEDTEVKPLTEVTCSKIPEVDQETDNLGLEELGDKALQVLTELLQGGSTKEPTANLLKSWRNANGPKHHEVWSSCYPADWFCNYAQKVEEHVKQTFPPLPTEDTEELNSYLEQVRKVVLDELLRLAPVLREPGLLDCVVDRYHCYTFSQLDLLLQRNLSREQAYCLLCWVLLVYLSDAFLGHPNLPNTFIKQIDLLLFTKWVQKAESQVQARVKEDISTHLQKILEREENAAPCSSTQGDDFNSLSKDVIQYLNTVTKKAERLHGTFMSSMRALCCQTLHKFLESYTELEKRRLLKHEETGMVHLFRTCNNCSQLRQFASQLSAGERSDSVHCMLDDLGSKVKQHQLKTVSQVAKVSLKKYFKEENAQLDEFLTKMQNLFADVSAVCDQDTRNDLVKSAYEHVTSLYQQQMLLSKHQHLEDRWGSVGDRVQRDAESLHATFSKLSVGVEKSVDLLTVSQILNCSDVEGLMLTCTMNLSQRRNSNETQLRSLLRWKGDLPKTKIQEVVETVKELSPTDEVHGDPLTAATGPPWYQRFSCIRPQCAY